MKYLISVFVVTSVLYLLSCQNNDSNRDPLQEARDYFVEYLVSHNKAYLDSSYYSLKSQSYLKDNGLNQQNNDLVIILLLHLKKYRELENLLIANHDMDDFNKSSALNIVRSLKNFKEDNVKAKGFIQENLRLVEREMAASPNDSLLWMGYFRMRMYIVGKQRTLQEIDSLRTIDTRYSDSFYDYFLIDAIEEYPKELLF